MRIYHIQGTTTQRCSHQWTALKREVFWQTGVNTKRSSSLSSELEKLEMHQKKRFPHLTAQAGAWMLPWHWMAKSAAKGFFSIIHPSSSMICLKKWIVVHDETKIYIPDTKSDQWEKHHQYDKYENENITNMIMWPKVMMAAAPPGLDQVFFKVSSPTWSQFIIWELQHTQKHCFQRLLNNCLLPVCS